MIPLTHRHLATLIGCFLLGTSLNSQSIAGSLRKSTGEPIPYANILLLAGPDSTFTRGTTTDDGGNFSLDRSSVKSGLLQVMALGYEVSYHSLGGSGRYDIVLIAGGVILDEVTVSDRKMLFELKPDRMVMNVSATPSLSGNTALQVLQKTPGVLVNRQNNTIGIGSQGEVMLMIGDRVQRAPAAVIMARLEAMPAANIETIEIIHQPPAKYDASGAAGIIRIILKRNSTEGANGNLSATAGYGRGPKAIGNLGLNSHGGSLTVSGDYTYNLDHSARMSLHHFRDYKYLVTDYFYDNYLEFSETLDRSHSANLGFDLRITDRSVVGGNFSLSDSRSSVLPSISRSLAYENGELTQSARYRMNMENRTRNGFVNLNFQQEIGKAGQVNFDLDYAGIQFRNTGSVSNIDSSTDGRITSDRDTPVKIWTGKVDYTREWGGRHRLEAGLKGTFSDIVSRGNVARETDSAWAPADLFTGTDAITERILAGYTSVTSDLHARLKGEMGLRFEHYAYHLRNDRDGGGLDQVWNNFFPLIRLNYSLDSTTTVQLSFNRTVTRPTFWMMAGFYTFLDPTLFAYANPGLQPALGSVLRLALQRRATLISLSYTRSRNDAFYHNTVDKPNHLQIVFPDNLDRSRLLALEFSSTKQLTSWWEVNGTLGARYHRLKDEEGRTLVFTNELLTYSAQLSTTITLSRGWSASMDGRYQSDFLLGDQVQFYYPYFNLGLRKKLSDGSSLSLSVQDPTNTLARIDWAYEQPELAMRTFGFNNTSEPQLRLTYSTNFGNRRIRGSRTRDTGATDIKKRL